MLGALSNMSDDELINCQTRIMARAENKIGPFSQTELDQISNEFRRRFLVRAVITNEAKRKKEPQSVVLTD